jgi:hypothetical protein
MTMSDLNKLPRDRLVREVRRHRAGWQIFVACGWCGAGMIWKREADAPVGYGEMKLAGCDNPDCEKHEELGCE